MALGMFIVRSDDLVQFCEQVESFEADDLTRHMLQSRLEGLQEIWEKLNKSYDDVVVHQSTSAEEKESVKAKYSNCTNRFHKVRAFIRFKLESLSPQPEARHVDRHDPNSSKSFMSESNITVPVVDIETFEGSYESWPAFRDLFSAVFIENSNVSSIQKLFHLKKRTKGEDKNIVQRYPLCAESFSLAWNALKQRYENKRLLVDNQLKTILNLQASTEESSASIQKIQTTISDCLATLAAQEIEIENWDPFIVYMCSTKLPQETLTLWEQSLNSRKDLPKWEDMEAFLIARFEVVERVNNIKGSSQKSHNSSNNIANNKKQNKQNKSMTNNSHNDSSKSDLKCIFCGFNHKLSTCHKFKYLPIDDRITFVNENKICKLCLSSTHFAKDCSSNIVCDHCKRSHHTRLHKSKPQNEVKHFNNNSNHTVPINTTKTFHVVAPDNLSVEINEPSTSESTQSVGSSSIQALYAFNTSNVLLPTALVTIRQNGELFSVRALIDPGSQSTFITSRVQQRLNLPVKPIVTSISAMGGKKVQKARQICFFDLVVLERSFEINISALVLPKLTNLLPSHNISKPDLTCFQNIELADPNFFKPGQIDLLIGSDVIPRILLDGLKKSEDGLCAAQNSVFGWFLSGIIPDSVQVFSTVVEVSEDTLISHQLRKFWETEELPPQRLISKSDQFCEDFYRLTTTRQKDGRYMVRLPFKDEFPDKLSLGPSRYVALKQYERTEKSLAKKPEIEIKYKEVLNEYLTLGHMSLTSPLEEVKNNSFHSFYLPHHAVLKPDSTSTKLRVVFNASKRTKSGASLNDILHIGPTLQNDLMVTLLRWRSHRFVFNGDVEKMYRQILMHPEDRPFQKILFRSSKGHIQDFCLNTVTFGVNCAPYLAIRTLHQLAEDVKQTHPTAAAILLNDTYVDDILTGSDTIENTLTAQNELISVLQSAGFPLKKITANSSQILSNIPSSDRLRDDFLEFEETSSAKTLGIKWNASKDIFHYLVKKIQPTNAITKRQMLSISASWFDPASWLTPFAVRAKILIQKLWSPKQDWDTAVEPRILVEWNKLVSELPVLEYIKIPRWIGTSPEREIELHGFCDASEFAYCACIYICSRPKDDSSEPVHTHLLVAKSKVAPLQTVSLPRLELCAAHLLSKLTKVVVSQSNINISQQTFWCDSTITLAWLKKPPHLLKTFVANRVTKILENAGDTEWRHVPSAQNSADLGTRGLSASDLLNSSLWWEGPQWLREKPESWPKKLTASINPPELKTFHCAIDSDDDILNLFSSLQKALRITARIWRFYENCKEAVRMSRSILENDKREKRRLPSETEATQMALNAHDITLREIQSAKVGLIIASQERYFASERRQLKRAKVVSKRSSLCSLNPFLDTNNILRADGRLKYAALTYNERHPIIISDKSCFCDLLINFTHKFLIHAEHQLMIRTLRQEFYIPRLKSKLKLFLRQCKPCILYKHRTKEQIMAALPPERVEITLAFTTTGIDFAGPFLVKSNQTRNAPFIKSYVCVFVCFTTKAIHLELCPDLSTKAFLDAFDRFVGRRGLPQKIVSDNGRNFVGADRVLQKEFRALMEEVVQSPNFKIHSVEWAFIPPGAPHMGGLWESAVKSFKKHLTKAAGPHSFTYVEFTTLLARIEGVLNSRPISALSADPSDLLPLTPAHFLRGGPLITVPEPNKANLPLINRYERMKVLHHQFSRRWKEEYLLELHKRNKWAKPQPNIRVNDLVVIKDDTLPPTSWRMGRILEVCPGRDDQVRSAKIKTQNGIVIRPIVKLVALPFETRPPNSQIEVPRDPPTAC